ncbi:MULTISPECIES: hypothetical protein [Galbibacter]|uniref:Lipoprotein n=1 Tax=Galbibacter pacificus TaxID=2996052 RepID=A0ABT6FRL6_9FLAO|nr:hypothetical protein [Galbibacter pacificus]MDG3582969.1 hypothetical protein [Galbibacter pacificus]MDG3585912.1 hypothetical protein [Galbibacter pacificus]
MKINKITANTFLQLGVLLSLVLLLTGCDQTRLKNKGNQLFGKNPYTSVTKLNLKEIPEGYAEVVTDTILSNNFVVKVKYHSTDDKVYKIENNPNRIESTAYKEFHSDVSVYFKDRLVLNKRIEKTLFVQPENNFWDKCIMQSISIDETASLTNDVVFNISFFNPSQEAYLDYKLVVNRSGSYYIQNIPT